MRIFALLFALLVTACKPGPQDAESDAPTAAMPSAPAVSRTSPISPTGPSASSPESLAEAMPDPDRGLGCLPVADMAQARVVDQRRIDFTMTRGERWTNRLPKACTGLQAGGTFSFPAARSQLCEGYEIHPVDLSARPRYASACALGRFTETR